MMYMHNFMIFLNQEVSDRPLAAFAFLAPVWTALQVHAQGFLVSTALLPVFLFWFIDVLLGSTRAAIDGRFDPSKAVNAIKRALIWGVALWVAYGIRISIPVVGNLIASMIEAVIILAEGSSILRNLALFSGDERAKRLLSLFADKLEDKIEDMTDDEDEEVSEEEN